MRKRFIAIAVLALAAALLFAGCAQPASSTPAASQKAAAVGAVGTNLVTTVDTRNTISVSAQGEKKIAPDTAYVTAGVTSLNEKLQAAQADNKAKMDAIYKALAAKGITKENIQTTDYSVDPQYNDVGGKTKITGYQVTNLVQITVSKIDAVGDILDACSAAGANTAYPISFDLKDKTAAYNEALKTAIANAKAKADVAAQATGVSIKGLVKMDENTVSASPAYDYAPMADVKSAAGAKTQISAGQMTLTASVTITYEVNNP